MRTADFSTILFESLQHAGQDRHNIRSETFAQFRDFINARLRQAWEVHPWPDLTKVVAFTATVDGNGVPFFTPAAEAGEVFSVYNKNPLLTTKLSQVDYYLDGTTGTTRAVLSNELVTSGFYMYRVKPVELVGDLYNSTTVYYTGAQVYFDSGSNTGSYMPVTGRPHSGNFWTCVAVGATNAGESPSTHPAKWTKVEIPYIFAPYLAWGAAADWFISEGNIESGSVVEGKANAVLDQELDKVLRQQGQLSRINITRTY